MKKDKKIQFEMDELGRMVSEVERPSLSCAKKGVLKAHLLRQVDLEANERFGYSESLFVGYLRRFSEVFLSLSRKAILKERILSIIEERSQSRHFVYRAFVFHKKLVSVTLMFAMVIGFFSFLNIEPGVVQAETFVSSFEGEVFVERDEKLISVYEGMTIRESDRLITGESGFLVVDYFNDGRRASGVSRISNNGEVFISKLQGNFEALNTQVELVLEKGAVWSRVVNLENEESSFVVKANGVVTLATRAAFNVQMDDDAIEVEVFSNVVGVEVAKDMGKIVSGFKAVVVENSEDIQIEEIDEEEKNLVWVQENLEDDKEYLLEAQESLLAEREGGSPEPSLREKTLLLLTFDDVEKAKREFDLAEKEFLYAQINLANRDLTVEERAEGNKTFMEFEAKVGKLYAMAQDFEERDAEYAKDLEKYVTNKLLLNKKDLGLVLPDSHLYEAKSFVDNLLVSGAQNDAEIAEVKRENALDKLAEVEDAIILGEPEKAEKALKVYKDEIAEVIDLVGDVSVDDSEDLKKEKEAVAQQISDDIELLQNLESIVLAQDEEVGGIVDEVVAGLKEGVDENGLIVEEKAAKPKIVKPSVVPVEIKKQDPIVEKINGVEVIEDGTRPLPPELGL